MMKTDKRFKNIYTVFAGGDDLLFVGPWTVMFEFASFLRQTFMDYTCNNSDITISACLVVSKPSFPLAQSVEDAEKGLRYAKDKGRNRIAIFGEILSWDDFNLSVEDGKFLDGLVNCGTGSFGINASFVYRLIKYYRMAKDTTKLQNLKWRSQLAYDIARNVIPLAKKCGATEQLERLQKITGLTPDNREINRLIVSASYCLYKNRSGR